MRVLFVAELYPWPATDGYRQRLAQQVRALAEVGDVDFFCPDRQYAERDMATPPDGVRTLHQPVRRLSTVRKAWKWGARGAARALMHSDPKDVATAFRTWARNPYDLVVVSHLATWQLVHEVLDGAIDAPIIVDLDNLDHLGLQGHLDLTADEPRNLAGSLRRRADQIDVKRMASALDECGASVERVVVCSELDLARSGLDNVAVMPNGCDPSGTPRDRTGAPGATPVLSFVGLMSYAPNADAARWFAREVLPLVRAEIPGATLRVVGRYGERLEDLRTLAGVEITGEVPDLAPELDRADVAVVPIRFGAGTRLKVVEALANRIPLVTTTVGCEGIDVVDGETALIADTATDFAAACVRALTDVPLRARLIDQGAELFEASYRWSQVRSRFGELCRSIAADRTASSS